MLSNARTLTDTMIIAGTRRLASLAPALQDPDDALLPDFEDAPRVNFEVAVAVVVGNGGGLGQRGVGNTVAAPVAKKVMEAVLNK